MPAGRVLNLATVLQDSYIVDHGSVGVWVWLGRLVGERDRLEALRNAQGFVRKKGYAAHTPITRVTDGCEPSEFRCLFRTWHHAAPVVPVAPKGGKSATNNAKPATTVHTRMDALALRDNARLAAELRLLDDGSGESRLWRVSRAGLVAVPAKRFGRLHSGECYVLHYRYGHPAQHAVFYWLVRDPGTGTPAATLLQRGRSDVVRNFLTCRRGGLLAASGSPRRRCGRRRRGARWPTRRAARPWWCAWWRAASRHPCGPSSGAG